MASLAGVVLLLLGHGSGLGVPCLRQLAMLGRIPNAVREGGREVAGQTGAKSSGGGPRAGHCLFRGRCEKSRPTAQKSRSKPSHIDCGQSNVITGRTQRLLGKSPSRYTGTSRIVQRPWRDATLGDPTALARPPVPSAPRRRSANVRRAVNEQSPVGVRAEPERRSERQSAVQLHVQPPAGAAARALPGGSVGGAGGATSTELSGQDDKVIINMVSLQELVKQTLQTDDLDARARAEKILTLEIAQAPESALLVFVAMATTSDHRLQVFGVLQVKRIVFALPDLEAWWRLSPQCRAQVQHSLLVLSRNAQVRGLVAELIGELMAQLSAQGKLDSWAQSNQFISFLFASKRPEQLDIGFKILEKQLEKSCLNIPSNEDMLRLLRLGLGQEMPSSLQTSAARTMLAFVIANGLQKSMFLKEVMGQFLQAVHAQVLSGEQGANQVLVDLIDNEPKLLAEQVDNLLDLASRFFSSSLPIRIKQTVLQWMVTLAQSLSKAFRENPMRAKRVSELILSLMVQIRTEIQEVYLFPPEGYSDEQQADQDYELTRVCMSSLDRLLLVYSKNGLTEHVAELFEKMLKLDDWRYPYSGIMALSQLGEFIPSFDVVIAYVNLLEPFVNHPNPKIRYAYCHLVGQLSDSLGPGFQVFFSEQILPHLFALMSDSIPRVRAHGINALTNFVEGQPFHKIEPIITTLLDNCIKFINEDCSLVKESVVNLISALCQSSSQQFTPYVERVLPQLFAIYDKFKGPRYHSLRAQTVEALTIIADEMAFQPSLMVPVVPKIVKVMLEGQADYLLTKNSTSYLISGWKRIFRAYSQQLVPHLEQILKVLIHIPKKSLEAPEDQDSAVTVSFLASFLDAAGTHALSILPEVKEIVNCYMGRKGIPTKTRKEAFGCLRSLVKESLGDQADRLMREYSLILLKDMDNEMGVEPLTHMSVALREMIRSYCRPFLSREELLLFYQLFLRINKDSLTRVRFLRANLKQNETETEELSIFADIRSQASLQIALCQLLAGVIRYHSEAVEHVVDKLMREFYPAALNESNYSEKALLSLGCDLIEFADSKVRPWWQQLNQLQCKGLSSTELQNVQVCAYALGKQSQLSTKDQVRQFGKKTVDKLIEAQKVLSAQKTARRTKKSKKVGFALDNVVAALGKFISQHFEEVANLAVVEAWLSGMPLLWDRIEALQQHRLFSLFLVSHFDKLEVHQLKKMLLLVFQVAANGLTDEATKRSFTQFVGKARNKAGPAIINSATGQQGKKLARLLSS